MGLFAADPPQDATQAVPELSVIKPLLSTTTSVVMSGAAQVGVDIHALMGQTPYGDQVTKMVEDCCHNAYAAADAKAKALSVAVDSIADGDDLTIPIGPYVQSDPSTAITQILLVDLGDGESAKVNGTVVSNWTEAVAALADGSEGMNLMCRFTSLSSFASGIAGVASKGLGASSKLASYPGATKADSLFSDTHSAAAASGIAMVDEGATFVYAQGLDLADQSANDELVEAASGAGRGILVHGVVGAQFLHSGHHMSDSALAVNQVSSTLQTIIPADSSAPTPDERALCVGVFYTQSKIVGTRGSILAALLTHQYMTRVGKLTLRL